MYGRGAKHRKTVRVCLTCEHPFTVKPGKNMSYCSYECNPKIIEKYGLDRFGPQKPPPKKLNTCRRCGNLTVNILDCKDCISQLGDVNMYVGR